MDSKLWAITSYFNPGRYHRRFVNYQAFRQRLDLPLLTVELCYGSEPELRSDDADILIQLDSRDVLWQKERLLNLAIAELPSECRYVAWPDCDVVFQSSDWPTKTCAALEEIPILQPYERVVLLTKEADIALPHQQHVDQELTPFYCLLDELPECRNVQGEFHLPNRSTTGYAWAARRELLEEHGFYDAAIIGGGDKLMAAASVGRFHDIAVTRQMNDAQRRHYFDWAEGFYASVQGRIGYLRGQLLHLWHGDTVNRRYRQRHADFQTHRFDPAADIKIASNRCWQWSSDKREMHEFIRSYFMSRREDG